MNPTDHYWITAFELVEPAFPRLQTVLSRIPLAQLPEYLHYDQRSGVISIRCRRLAAVKRQPLFQELVAECPQVKLHGSHYIRCPADWFLGVLSDSYGRPVVLPHAKDPN